MGYRLRRTVNVAERRFEPSEIVVLDAGTPIEEIPEEQLDQLSPDHFSSEDGDAPLVDWRPDEARTADVEAEGRRAEWHAEIAARRAELEAQRSKQEAT